MSEPKYKIEYVPKNIKDLVWDRYIGHFNAIAPCQCCFQRMIHISDFHNGHSISKAHGGGTQIKNLRPICHQCNLGMKTMNMGDYMKKWKFGPYADDDSEKLNFKKLTVFDYNNNGLQNMLATKGQTYFEHAMKEYISKLIKTKFEYELSDSDEGESHDEESDSDFDPNAEELDNSSTEEEELEQVYDEDEKCDIPDKVEYRNGHMTYVDV